MKITLLYRADCPHVEPTRVELEAALSACGRSPIWDEVDLESSEDRGLQRYASPTVLIDGKDVAGTSLSAGPSCRMYQSCCGLQGYPSRDLLLRALQVRTTTKSSDFCRWIPVWVGGFSLASLLVPIGLCPACWPAYLTALSGLGLGALATQGLLGPLAGVLLLMAIAPLGIIIKETGCWESGVWASGGVLLVFLGQRLSISGLGVLGASLLVLGARVAIRTSRSGSSPNRT